MNSVTLGTQIAVLLRFVSSLLHHLQFSSSKSHGNAIFFEEIVASRRKRTRKTRKKRRSQNTETISRC